MEHLLVFVPLSLCGNKKGTCLATKTDMRPLLQKDRNSSVNASLTDGQGIGRYLSYQNVRSMRLIYITIFLLTFATGAVSQDPMDLVEGTITNTEGEPMSNVSVNVKNSKRGTSTNVFGKYSLQVKLGDTLLIQYLGYQAQEVLITKIPCKENIILQDATTQLDEVEVSARRRRTQVQLLKEYDSNKNLIKTSLGVLDKETASGSMRMIDGDKLINIGGDFLESLKTYFPNMLVSREDGVKVFPWFVGGASAGAQAPAVFEVDGMIQAAAPTYLMASEIDRIAVLQRNAAYSRYGPLGAGGAIIVNTKGQTAIDELGVDRTFEKQQLLDSMTFEAAKFKKYTFTSPYVTDYQKQKSKKRAFSLYNAQKKENSANPHFFMDVYHHFLTTWGPSEESKIVLQDLLSQFENDKILRALAFMHEQQEDHRTALWLFSKTLALAPEQVQANRDVAQSLSAKGDHENALRKYNWLAQESKLLPSDPSELEIEHPVIATEFKNILARLKDSYKDVFQAEGFNPEGTGTRIVFDCNIPDAQFQIQIENPFGDILIWDKLKEDNTTVSNPVFRSKQFFLDENIPGTWIVNFVNPGNSGDAPAYLKLSIQRNLGQEDQTLKVEVYRISSAQEKFQLAEIVE